MKETNTNIQEHIPQVIGFCCHTKTDPLSLQHKSFTQTQCRSKFHTKYMQQYPSSCNDSHSISQETVHIQQNKGKYITTYKRMSQQPNLCDTYQPTLPVHFYNQFNMNPPMANLTSGLIT